MNSPQFSIIIPVYNAADYLAPLLNQLQDQTVQDFEVIFVNDCSPDNSVDILARLAERDERVRVFHHESNRCQGAARNTGLDNARGKYILYIDADDSVPHNYLESLYNAIEKNNADLAICNSIWVYPDREVHHNMFIDNPDLSELLLTGEEALQHFYSIFKSGIRIPVEPWGRIIRRSMIEKYQLRNPETLHEDVVMGYSELLFSRKVMLLNRYLYYYNRKNIGSVLLERKKQYLLDFPYIFIGIQNVLLDSGQYEQQRKWLTRFYFSYLAGVYDCFSKGEDFSEEMHTAILHYRTLLPDPLIDDSEKYISRQLNAFKLEMVRCNLSEVFSVFIEAHPEVHSLIQKNLYFCLMYYMNLIMRIGTMRNIYLRIVIDPRTDSRRQIITHMFHMLKQVFHHLKFS